MIGRAGVGQPWLIKKLIAEMSNENFIPLDASEVASIFMLHTEQLAALLGNEKFAILQARKFARYYARGLLNKTEFCDAVNACDSLHELKAACSRYFML